MPFRLRAVTCVQFFESSEQAGKVFRLGGVHQIEVQCADRGSLENSGNGAGDDKVNLVPVQNFEQLPELEWFAHGR